MSVQRTPTQTRALWLLVAALGGAGLVGLSIWVSSVGPIDRMCRGMLAETAALPDSFAIGSCNVSNTAGRNERAFTAEIPLNAYWDFLRDSRLPVSSEMRDTEPKKFRWSSETDHITVGWSDGTMTYFKSSSGSAD